MQIIFLMKLIVLKSWRRVSTSIRYPIVCV